MNFYLHISIHLFFAFLAGLIIWRIFKPKNPFWAFLGGFLGGFCIDFDHFIDYFLAFGFNFKLDYFIHGYSFLKTDKIHILFHGWEYVILLVMLGFILAKTNTRPVALRRNATGVKIQLLIFAIALGAFFHLGTDVVLNEGLTAKSYSLILRAKNGFQMEKTVTPEHWQNHLKKKNLLQDL